jgi:regulator of replication initiation timing
MLEELHARIASLRQKILEMAEETRYLRKEVVRLKSVIENSEKESGRNAA